MPRLVFVLGVDGALVIGAICAPREVHLDDEGLAREMARGNRCYLADTLRSQGTVCRSTPEPSDYEQAGMRTCNEVFWMRYGM
ncbi:hypothetical protein ACHAXH_000539 [Discostella pseudostelligera]